MHLFTPTRLALALALLSPSASAAPHPPAKRCNPAMYEQCWAATDCCAFSYCQSIVLDDGSAIGYCFPGFSETPYVKVVTPAEALPLPSPPDGKGEAAPPDPACNEPWYDKFLGVC